MWSLWSHAFCSKQVAVAVKLSRQNAAAKLANECSILRRLEGAQVARVVRCIEECDVAVGPTLQKGIVLSPFLEDAKQAGAGELPGSLAAQKLLVADILTTAVAVLHAGVAGVDVQVLVQPTTGMTLWIDFTEAVLLDAVSADEAEQAALSFAFEVLYGVPRASSPYDFPELFLRLRP
eukprot:1308088-Amphidinium_carterae.1